MTLISAPRHRWLYRGGDIALKGGPHRWRCRRCRRTAYTQDPVPPRRHTQTPDDMAKLARRRSLEIEYGRNRP